MPPKKATQKSVRSLFEAYPTGASHAKTQKAQDGEEMELTKTDLMETLQQFKSELRAELTSDINRELQDLKNNLNEKFASLRNNVDSVGSRILETEAVMQNLERQASSPKDTVYVSRSKQP